MFLLISCKHETTSGLDDSSEHPYFIFKNVDTNFAGSDTVCSKSETSNNQILKNWKIFKDVTGVNQSCSSKVTFTHQCRPVARGKENVPINSRSSRILPF